MTLMGRCGCLQAPDGEPGESEHSDDESVCVGWSPHARGTVTAAAGVSKPGILGFESKWSVTNVIGVSQLLSKAFKFSLRRIRMLGLVS